MLKTDMLTMLEREHRNLEGQLKMLISSGEACQCVDALTLKKLVRTLGFHMQNEELLLYSKAEDEREVSNLIQDFYGEHREIKSLLQSLARDNTPVDEVLRCCTAMLSLFQRHIQREENQLFPVLRNRWDEDALLALGNKMLEQKDRELSGR